MPHFLSHALPLVLPLSITLLACGASDGSRRTVTDDAGADASASGGSGGARPGTGGSNAGGTSAGGKASAGGTPGGGAGGAPSGGASGASSDSGVDARDGQSDGSPDAARPVGDASADAGNPLIGQDVVYVVFGGMLVWIDPGTARLTEVGRLRNAANESQTYPAVTMTWSRSGATALTTLGYMNATFATVDLCTGLATVGPAFTRAASPNLVVEGLSVATNGTVYVTSGNSTTTISPNLGTLDASTGVITNLGSAVTSYQNDIDMLFFAGAALYGMDVDTPANRLDLFTLNLATGANTRVAGPTFPTTNEVPLRIAYSEQRAAAYAWRRSDRNLLEYSLTTGTSTRAIGETHPAAAYAGQSPTGFFVAPLPACP